MSPKQNAPRKKKPRRPLPPFPPKPKPFRKRRPKPVKFKLNVNGIFAKTRAAAKIAAGAIVKEIIFEIEQAVAANGKTLSNDAFQEFRPRLLVAITGKLLNNGNWTTDGPGVRAAGAQMGVIAAALAHPSSTVTKANIHPAFYSVKNGSTVCSATSGAGSWCDFYI